MSWRIRLAIPPVLLLATAAGVFACSNGDDPVGSREAPLCAKAGDGSQYTYCMVVKFSDATYNCVTYGYGGASIWCDRRGVK